MENLSIVQQLVTKGIGAGRRIMGALGRLWARPYGVARRLQSAAPSAVRWEDKSRGKTMASLMSKDAIDEMIGHARAFNLYIGSAVTIGGAGPARDEETGEVGWAGHLAHLPLLIIADNEDDAAYKAFLHFSAAIRRSGAKGYQDPHINIVPLEGITILGNEGGALKALGAITEFGGRLIMFDQEESGQ